MRLRQRKVFKPRKNVLYIYSDQELVKRYRLDRAGFIFVTNLVRRQLESPTGRSMAISAEMKVMTTLRYLATGKMQLCNGDDFGLSQPSISRVISQTLDALSSSDILRQFVSFPVEAREIQTLQSQFMQIARFPGIVGTIDGTHTFG